VAPNSLIRTDGNRDIGLSEIGRETLREMNRIGLLADLAHASFKTTTDAAEITTQPILSTHSLVRATDGFGMTAEHAKTVAATGGVIGTFGGVRGGMAGFIEHVLRLIDTVGIEHVGIGTDMDGTGNLPAAFDRYPLLPEATARLLASGLHEDEVASLIGGNVARVLEEVRSGANKM
jgi:membrane dipeptidase